MPIKAASLQNPVMPVFTHQNPHDFTVAFTSGNTITVAGAPFVVDDANCTVVFVQFRPSGGVWQPRLYSPPYDISAAANVITVVGADTTPFHAGDEYRVGILYQEKAYNAATNSFQSNRLNPEWNHNLGETAFSVAAGAAANGTYDYYVDLDTYPTFGIQTEFTPGAGTLTLNVEGTLQDDGTAAASCAYQNICTALFGVPNITATGMYISNLSQPYRYLHLELVVAGSDAATAYDVYVRKSVS